MYTSYDYLWSEPYYIEGLGYLKCPTLLEIRKMTYNIFLTYLNLITSSKDEIISLFKLGDPPTFSEVPLFHILLSYSPVLLLSFIKTFTTNSNVRYNSDEIMFEMTDVDNDQIIGQISSDNFDLFRGQISVILGLKKEVKESKFASERARKLVEGIEKNRKKQKKHNEDRDLDNMVLKFCSNNKTGINLLNVGDLTYYQFIKLFNEYAYARQADYGDALAANTFCYKEAKDYKPDQWIKKINDTE